ncbi:hypothetical protein EMCRGX_G012958 [Ephydatia muelleri]
MWGPEALKAFSQVATRLAIRGNTSKSMALTDLFGRLSHSLIRANARAILSIAILGNLQLNKCESALKGLTNLSYSGHAHVFTLNGAQPLPSGHIRGQKRTDSQQQCPMGSTFLSMPNNPWCPKVGTPTPSALTSHVSTTLGQRIQHTGPHLHTLKWLSSSQ